MPALSASTTRIAAALAAAMLAAFAFAPALAAGFHYEDFSYLALMRHLDAPWPLLVDNVYFVYYYRATGMLFWWLAVHGVGTDAWWHNLFDLMLHAGNAAMIALYAARAGRSTLAGLLAGACFACLPPAAGTAMWMSDRYDPLALLFGMFALLAFERALDGSRRALVAGAGLLLLAITSKEVAYAFAGVMLARIGWRAWRDRRVHVASLLAVLIPVAIALALRELTVQRLDASLGVTDVAAGIVTGTLSWWQRLPAALAGFQLMPASAHVLLAVLAIVALTAIGVATAARHADVTRLAIAGAVLVLVPSIVQWPVTSLVLPHEASLHYVANLRFYHLASAGVALLLAAAWLALGVRAGRAMFAMALAAACAVGLVNARGNAQRWTDLLGAPGDAYLTLGRELGARTFPPGCRIALDTTALSAAIPPYIDTAVKSAVPRGASILGCSVSAGRPSFATLITADLCAPQHWPGLGNKPHGGQPGFQRIGALCAVSFNTPDDARVAAPRFAFVVDADGHVRETEPVVD